MSMVKSEDFKIVKGEDKLKLYQFHSKIAKHYFCSNCGIYTHHNPRANPAMTGFNLGCVDESLGEYMESSVVTKGIAGEPDVPAPYYAITTLVFKDKSALDGALSKIDKPVADIANFTNTKPIMLIGDVVG